MRVAKRSRSRSVRCGWRFTAAAALVAGSTSACGRILGVDGYRVAPQVDGGTPSYLGGAACIACLGEHCRQQLQVCESSEMCQANLACQSDCDGPSCQERCDIIHSPLDGGIPPHAPLVQCGRLQCNQACLLGKRLDCVGKHTPQFLYAPNAEIQIAVAPTEFPGGAALDGVRVVPCEPFFGDGCESSPKQTFVQNGDARVQVLSPDGTGWAGTFSFIDERQGGGMDAGSAQSKLLRSTWKRTIPFTEGLSYSVSLPTRAVVEDGLSRVEAQFKADRGYVYVQAWDCVSDPARDLVLEVTTPPSATTGSTRDFDTIVYWSGSQPTLGLDRTSGDGTASVNSLPAGVTVVLTLTEFKTGRVVSQAQVTPIAGGFVRVDMFPLTREQQASR